MVTPASRNRHPKPAREKLIYPKYYYQRCGGESDRDWILTRMFYLPNDKRKEVADHYEDLYRSKGRKEANTYLQNIAKPYYEKYVHNPLHQNK